MISNINQNIKMEYEVKKAPLSVGKVQNEVSSSAIKKMEAFSIPSETVEEMECLYAADTALTPNNKIESADEIQRLSSTSISLSNQIENFKDKIYGLLGIETAKETAMRLLAFNRLDDIDIDEIMSIEKRGVHSENILITLTNGEEYLFDEEQRLIKMETEDFEIYYNYDISAYQRESIVDFYNSSGTASLLCKATATIRGHEIHYYLVDDRNTELETNGPINFSRLYALFSDEILEALDDFAGVVIAPKDLSLYNPLGGKYGAYVSTSNSEEKEIFMFVPDRNLNSDYYKYNTPLHEMSHVIQSLHDIDEAKLSNLWDAYKTIMPQLNESCYSSNHFESTPNSDEFFADAVTNYFLNRKQLQRYMPEVYAYIDNIFLT